MWKLGFAALLAILAVRGTDAVCNKCNSNGIACIGRSEFHLCFDNKPNSSVTYKCPSETQICTNFRAGCMDAANAPSLRPACGDTSKCGVCEHPFDGSFSCTSRTTFTMCINNGLSAIRGKCPPNQFCDPALSANGEVPCTRQCFEDVLNICDLETPIDEPPPNNEPTTTTPGTPTISPTTPTEPTTTRPTPGNPAAICAAQSAAGRYPYPNDVICRGYVTCYWKSGVLEATPSQCPTGRYFNSNTRNCQVSRPLGCV